MRIERVRWRNFLSTGNAFIEVDLSSPGTTLIIGDNGCGKCLVGATSLNVEFKNEEVKKAYRSFVKHRSHINRKQNGRGNEKIRK